MMTHAAHLLAGEAFPSTPKLPVSPYFRAIYPEIYVPSPCEKFFGKPRLLARNQKQNELKGIVRSTLESTKKNRELHTQSQKKDADTD